MHPIQLLFLEQDTKPELMFDERQKYGMAAPLSCGAKTQLVVGGR